MSSVSPDPAGPGSKSVPVERSRLRRLLGDAVGSWAGEAWTEDRFNRLALEVFRYQATASPIYGAFVAGRGVDPDTVDDWREVPPVPARAFKEVTLLADASAGVEATFLTSGTTSDRGPRGRHQIRDLSLYHASALATALRFLRPDLSPLESAGLGPDPMPSTAQRPTASGAENSEDAPQPTPPFNRTRIRVLCLAPSSSMRSESSLIHMFGLWMESWDDGGGGYFCAPDWTLDAEALRGALEAARHDRVPVLLAGTAFSFVEWLDGASGDDPIVLPPGSILLETGGFKGRSRTVPRGELYRELSWASGVPGERIVNEYGMTEMLSQFYEPVILHGGPAGPEERHHAAPPWVRTRALDPITLGPAPEGEPGLLCHFDLANLDSVSSILTQDMGILVDGGFRLLGRVEGSEPRGCSLAMEELLDVGRAGVDSSP